MDLTEPLVQSLAFGLDSFGLGWVGIDYLVESRFDLGESLVWCGLFWFDSVQFNSIFNSVLLIHHQITTTDKTFGLGLRLIWSLAGLA